jgi:hypothetical protein
MTVLEHPANSFAVSCWPAPERASGQQSSYRGRDAHFCAPPAQIPAGVIHAPGSHLGCLTAKRTLGQG